MNKIALWIYVHVGDWTVERAIIASNGYGPQNSLWKCNRISQLLKYVYNF